MEKIPRIRVHLTDKNFVEDVKKVMDVVRPEWLAADVWPRLKTKIFTDGITNKLVGYSLPEAPRDAVIVKIYGSGTETMIDRKAEIETMTFLSARGMGSRIFGIFDNGIAYEFIPGKTLDPISCRDPKIYPLVAAEMAKLHSIPLDQVPQDNRAAFWNKLNTFQELAADILDKNAAICQGYAAFGLTKSGASQSIQKLKNFADEAGMPFVFCHNDILLPNVVYDEETARVSFIDFEYAMINYGPFDVANHFNEFAGVDNADFSLCPDRTFMAAWIEEYLKHWKNSEMCSLLVDVQQFLHWVVLCIPLSHLFWAIWTVVQAQNSSIDFDYIAYGEKRFTEYQKTMKIFESYTTKVVCNGDGDVKN